MKPLIGVTSNYIYSYMPKLDKGSEEHKSQFEQLKKTYVGSCLYGFNEVPFNMSLSTDIQAIEKAGGVPIIIPQTENESVLRSVLNRLDGIVFVGGNDMDPKFYGEEIKYNKGLYGTLNDLNPEDASVFAPTVIERDRMELMLMEMAVKETALPILGICRGAQVMNVAFGGNLYQDLEKCYDREGLIGHANISKWSSLVHEIDLEKGTLIHEIFNQDRIGVNSIHHQSIRKLGEGLKATAFASDGVVEAIEHTDNSRFILGVQWHPEMLYNSVPEHKGVFDKFIEACQK